MSTGHATTEFRAAGTDISERRRSGVSKGPLMDIVPASDISGMNWGADGTLRIGAYTTIAAIAADRSIAAAYPGIAASAQGLATPQIRHLATLGGNLAQRSRCWYFRNPHIACLKKGGTDCPARNGNHLYHVAFDLGPCVAPHPSTMAAALLAYDATIITYTRSGLSIPDVLGDGSNGAADNMLQPGEMIRGIELPKPLQGERAFYKRAISRSLCGMAAGRGLRPRGRQGRRVPVHPPRRRRHRAGAAAAEGGGRRALQGKAANALNIEVAAKLAISGAKPLPMTGYKLDLLEGVVRRFAGEAGGS